MQGRNRERLPTAQAREGPRPSGGQLTGDTGGSLDPHLCVMYEPGQFNCDWLPPLSVPTLSPPAPQVVWLQRACGRVWGSGTEEVSWAPGSGLARWGCVVCRHVCVRLGRGPPGTGRALTQHLARRPPVRAAGPVAGGSAHAAQCRQHGGAERKGARRRPRPSYLEDHWGLRLLCSHHWVGSGLGSR